MSKGLTKAQLAARAATLYQENLELAVREAQLSAALRNILSRTVHDYEPVCYVSCPRCDGLKEAARLMEGK
jgi:hypothetical protein